MPGIVVGCRAATKEPATTATDQTQSGLAAASARSGPLALLGKLVTARGDWISNFSAEAYEVPILEQRFLWRRHFILSDPASIKRVYLDNFDNYTKTPVARRLLEPGLGKGLLTMQGEEWRRHRRILAPAFDHHNIVANAPLMVEVAEDRAASWDRLPSGTVVDMVDEMMQATLRIIARTMFSTEPQGLAAGIARSVRHYQKKMHPSILDLLGLSEWIPGFRRERAVQRAFSATNLAIERLIAERRAAPDIGRTDLLSRLIAARDEDTGAPLTAKEIRDHVVTFFMAGHETTSVALSWTWYLLSQHGDAEAKLHRELDTVLNGRTPTYADIAGLAYTRMVIEEAMRLYPPAHTMSRQAQGEDVVGGQRIRKGTILLIVPWVLHRHRRLWERPDAFEPERFAPDRAYQRSRFAYIPFGAGPRICIGAAFAMTEAILVLATLAQRYRPHLVPGHPVAPQGLITLRPRHGLKMTLERRR